ncbi:MAG TPA: hypothetical protein VFX03_05990, partial [Thermomicrobiales bacterium]|nr:hypothetical protein [Thermomicrobiales bacterium]
GTLELADGAAAVGAILFVDSGGVLQIDDTTMPAATISGFTSDDTIDLRGVGGGDAGSATLDNGNVLTVHEGGVDYALQLDPAEDFTGDSFLVLDDNFGGTRVLVVESGIIVIGPGETVVVSGGQVVGNLDVFGTLVVGSGGIVLAADVESGGTETVAAGGLDISGTVESGGSQDVFGTVSATILIAGGRQTIEVGGIADGVVLDDAAVQDVFGFAGATIVSASDMQVVEAGGVASGTTISRGGVETVLSGGLTRDTVVDGGALDLQEGSEAAGTIAFAAIGSVLRIDGATMPTATITGFERGDVIDLADLSPGSGSTVTFDAATGILTISGSTV